MPISRIWRNTASRDYRGGGRSSARETAMRVAAGAVARKIIPSVTIRGALVQIGKHRVDRGRWSWGEVDNNPFFSPDAGIVDTWSNYLDEARKAGSSVGAVIEVVAEGVALRLGRADLRQARFRPRRRHDEHQRREGRRDRRRHGGSRADRRGQRRRDPHGQRRQAAFPLQQRRRHPRRHLDRPADRRALRRQADLVDPHARRTIDRFGNDTEISTKGRHDPCVGIRAVPVGEAMMAIVLADHFLRHRAQVGRGA
jgi:chorismate synthase